MAYRSDLIGLCKLLLRMMPMWIMFVAFGAMLVIILSILWWIA